MAVLPYSKHFRFVKGATFDYAWQYLTGVPDNSTPFDLTSWSALWTIHAPGGNITYATGALAGHSGVFFGQGGPVTNGIIELVISSTDSAAFNWSTAPYTFSIQNTANPPVVLPLLTGSISSVLNLP